MAMKPCAIVVLSSGGTKGFLTSLESIARQDASIPLEIIIATEPDAGMEQKYLRILDQSPWISNWRIVEGLGGELFQEMLQVSSAEYFLLITMGDVLPTNAVRLHIDAMLQSNKDISFGVARWTNGRVSWSHNSVDELFRKSEPLSYDLSFLLQTLSLSATGIFHRSALLTQGTKCLAPAALVHEYVCRRSYDGNPGYRRAYRNREIKSRYGQVLHAVPFPQKPKVGPETKENIWLFGERGGEAAEDNGLALFQYCKDKAPNIECYYVLNEGVNCSGLNGYESNVIYKTTDAWESKLKQASHFFFTDSAADILVAANDIGQFPNVTSVYLTHGCLAYSPGVYQKSHQYIDYVTCTNRQDIESASRGWGFPKSKFLLTGLARWDRLQSNLGGSKEILLCPTWRKRFNSSHWNTDEDISEEDLETFRNSSFFVYFSSFLQSPELLSILERDNLFITVNLHFRFRNYLTLFNELSCEQIRIATPENDHRNLREMMEDAVALITDYSSIMWDMGFMEKPVICYQFDKPEMLAERGKEQFSITDDMLFAKVCYSESSLVDALNDLALRDFCNDEQQAVTLNKYIPQRDAHNCERIYKAITSLNQTVARQKVPNNSRNSHSINSSERIEGVLHSLSSVSSVAVIANLDLSSYANVTELKPDTWKEVLNAGAFDVVVVEPHLNARNLWAPVFFEPQETRSLLEDLIGLCESRNIRTMFCESPIFHNVDSLQAVANRFSKVLPAEQMEPTAAQLDVSVIIPAYNSEDYLSKTIDSVLCQHFVGKIEIIIVNDGSTDGTQGVIDRYSTDYSNVVGIKQGNARQGMARNHALLAARGEYVMYLDSDDILPANAVAELHHALKYNETRVATGLVASCDSSGNNQRINQAYYHYTKAPGTITAESWSHVFYDPSCAGKMYQRQFLLDSKLFFPQSFHEDQVFMFKLFSSMERIAVTKSVVYLYIARPVTSEKSGTQTFTNEKFWEMLLAGTLARSVVKQSVLPGHIIDYALGFLVMRYDRFLWKQSSMGDWGSDSAIYAETVALLERFLSEIPDEVIWRNARYCAVFLLLTKRSMHELAARLRADERVENLEDMVLTEALPVDIRDALELEPEVVSKYNYYKAVPIGNLSDNSQIVTEMSYGYRLGQVFVDVSKSPGKIFLVPWQMVVLLYDMVSRKGRVKEKHQKEVMLQNSSQALLNHSAFIKSTASYRLGVAIMEAFTSSPRAVLKLPGKIRRIYEQTA